MYGPQADAWDVPAHGPMNAVLRRLVDSFGELQLPVRSMQLNDWWFQGGEPETHDHMCL